MEDRGHSCLVANVAVRGMQFAVTELKCRGRGLVSSNAGARPKVLGKVLLGWLWDRAAGVGGVWSQELFTKFRGWLSGSSGAEIEE